MENIAKFKDFNESFYPKSELSDSFQMLLSDELNKLPGKYWVEGFNLYKDGEILLTINPDKDSVGSVLNKIKKVLLLKKFENIDRIEEDGGGGAAVATGSTTSGMGNVVSAQPASTPGAASTGDGTTGSGDYGNPLFPTAKKDGSNTVGKKKSKKKEKGKKDKKEKAIEKFLKNYRKNNKSGESKSSKSSDGNLSTMKSFDEFTKNK